LGNVKGKKGKRSLFHRIAILAGGERPEMKMGAAGDSREEHFPLILSRKSGKEGKEEIRFFRTGKELKEGRKSRRGGSMLKGRENLFFFQGGLKKGSKKGGDASHWEGRGKRRRDLLV